MKDFFKKIILTDVVVLCLRKVAVHCKIIFYLLVFSWGNLCTSFFVLI